MKRYQWSSLTVLPILFFIAANVARQARGAFWQGQYDPNYFYLLNSLGLVVSETPSLVQHPGTPLQILGAIVIIIRYFGGTFFEVHQEGLVYTVLEAPETFIAAINTSIVLLIAIALFGVGLIAFYFSKNLVLSLIPQVFLFLPRTNFSMATAIQAEIMLLLVAQILIALLLAYLYKDQVEDKPWFAIALGAIFGFGMAVKITFAPLIIFFLLIPKFRLKVIAGVTALLSFLIGTLPIISKYGELFAWLKQLGLRSGQYGGGDKAVVDLARVPLVFNQFFREYGSNGDTFFFILTGASVLFYGLLVCFWYYQKRQDKPSTTNLQQPLFAKLFRLLSCLISIFIVQIALAIKGEGLHYLVPTMGLCGLLVFVQLATLEVVFPPISTAISTTNELKNLSCRYIPLLALTLFLIVGFNNSYKYIQGGLMSQFYIQAETRAIAKLMTEQYSQCEKLMLLGSFSRQYAIKTGAYGIDTVVAPYLTERYPDYFFARLGTNDQVVDGAGDIVDLAEQRQQNCIVIQTSQSNPPAFRLPVTNVFQGSYQTVYLLSSSK